MLGEKSLLNINVNLYAFCMFVRSPQPSQLPTELPTPHPTTLHPSPLPTLSPSFLPTPLPTYQPTPLPTASPSYQPTALPTTPVPTSLPTNVDVVVIDPQNITVWEGGYNATLDISLGMPPRKDVKV